MSKASNIIRVTIDNQSIKAKGFFFDAKGNNLPLSQVFFSEQDMEYYFDSFRERDFDFQLVIERNQSKVIWS